jgi:NADP-reducing hydrogenase subunit HndC
MTYRSMVLVSYGPTSLQNGAQELYQSLQDEIRAFGLADEISISTIDDLGRVDAIPMVIVYPEAVLYGPVTPEDAHHLVEEHLYKGRIVEELRAPVRELTGSIAWLRSRQGTLPAEQRIVLQRAGIIDPQSIEEYIIHNGYEALAKMFAEMSPKDVIDELDKSGLRGRGGAGSRLDVNGALLPEQRVPPSTSSAMLTKANPGPSKIV